MFEGLKSRMTGKRSMGGLLGLGGARVLIGASYTGQALEGYQKCAYAYRCVNIKADALASIPWLLYTEKGGDELDRHPLLDLLAHPNPRQGGSEFIRNVEAYLQLNGNSYTYAPPNTLTGPKELYSLRPDMTQPIEGNAENPVAYYMYSGKWGSTRIAPEDMMHLKCFNPMDEIRGMSPLLAAALAIQQNNESHVWNVATLQHGGRPSGVLSTQGNLNDKQADRMRKDMKDKYSGAANASKIMVLEAGMSWTQVGMTAEEMSWLEGIKLSAREISLVFGVPPEIVGDSSNKTYSNYQEARKAFWQETVLPEAYNLRDELNNWLAPKFKKKGGKDLYLDINIDAIDALQEDRTAMWNRLNATNWLTINEKRQAAGYDAIGSDGDVIFVPATNLPLDMATQPFTSGSGAQ